MIDTDRWFSSKQYVTHSRLWISAIARRENVAVVFFPKTDRIRRLDQLIHDTGLQSALRERILFQQTRLDLVDDRRDLEQAIMRGLQEDLQHDGHTSFMDWIADLRTQAIRLVVVIPAAENLLTPSGRNMMTLLSQLTQETDGQLTVLSLFETDITHSLLQSQLPVSTSLFQNVFEYPVYMHEDTLQLVQYLAARWNAKLTPIEEEGICVQSGGHLWIASEAVRQCADGNSWSIDSEGMQFRLKSIYATLLSSERSVLEKKLSGARDYTDEERESMVHLKQLRVLDTKGACAIPLLVEYIRTIRSSIHQLQYDDVTQHITLNGVPIDNMLSRKERHLLRVLVQKINTVVSRDDVASAIWPHDTETHYSDWAIDQTIARLRKRLGELMIPSTTLRVIRGKGYMLARDHTL
jgi:DNA-binding winged helix-turn-helix (wHTH) protein